MWQRIHNVIELKGRRKQLRNNGTSAEAVLWMYLKKSQLDGRKFRRQHSIGKYIADFYCPQEKLVIELDGEGHFWEGAIEYDKTRILFLNKKGIRVLSFENKWVFQDLDFVLTEIKNHFVK